MKHLIETTDLTKQEVDKLLDLADDIIRHPQTYQKSCEGKVLATLFYEPSTRTRLSFESAMLHLGGSALGFSSADTSSATKGETVADTIRMVSCYADICAMRHPLEGAPKVAALNSSIPVINAGDGGHQHPTQTLTDLLTIRSLKGTLSGLTIGLCGDLKYGRTVHSLLVAMSRYEGVKFIFIAPDELKMPQYLIDGHLVPAGLEYEWNPSLEGAIGQLDVLYMTRIQQERFADRAEYERLQNVYVLDAAKMQLARPDMIVMHPLPRVNEISVEVDDDPRAKYFEQAQYGRFARMALILSVVTRPEGFAHIQLPPTQDIGDICHNPRCITTTERGLKPRFVQVGEGHKCLYCEQMHTGEK